MRALQANPSGAIDPDGVALALVGSGPPRITIGDVCPILSISDWSDSLTCLSF